MHATGEALKLEDLPDPEPASGQVRIRIRACAICRTDLHVLDGELPDPKLPLIPGHEVVGTVDACGPDVTGWEEGDPIGVPWLAYTCGECKFCERGEENLCENALFHGYTVDGGYADTMVANAAYCLRIPEHFLNPESTPLFCAGLIGYRSYRKTDPDRVEHLGLYGFGASAHLVAQVALHEGKRLYAFTREGDEAGQAFAREMGCHWAGASTEQPPHKLDAAIIFAPVGELMVTALKAVDKGGRVVSAGIHMSPIPEFEYRYLWEERSLHSVANLTREDGSRFISLAEEIGIRTQTHAYPLEKANDAIADLRKGKLEGVAVLVPET